jgi:hypothetical protein
LKLKTYEMKFRLPFLLLLALAVIASGCKGKKEPARAEILFSKKSKGIFRNVDFDIETVKKNETAPLVNSSEDYLRYEIADVNGNKMEFIEFEYMFENNRLDRIMVFYTVERKEHADGLYFGVLDYFTKKFGGTSGHHDAWRTWELEDKKGLPGKIEIMTKKQTEENIFGVDIEMVKYYKDEEKKPTSLLYLP